MTPEALALREAFWAAMPAKRRVETRKPYDDELFQACADHALQCARTAYRYGDRGEVLVRNTATNLASKFWDLCRDERAPPPLTDADRRVEAPIWTAAARALLDAAQAQKAGAREQAREAA